jgi:hypothetical protein
MWLYQGLIIGIRREIIFDFSDDERTASVSSNFPVLATTLVEKRVEGHYCEMLQDF